MTLENCALFGFKNERQFERLKTLIGWQSYAKFNKDIVVFTNGYKRHNWRPLLSSVMPNPKIPCGWQLIHVELLEIMLEYRMIEWNKEKGEKENEIKEYSDIRL